MTVISVKSRNLNNIPGAAGVLAASDVQLKAAATEGCHHAEPVGARFAGRVASAIGSASVNWRQNNQRRIAHIKELKGILPSGITGQANSPGSGGGTPTLEIDLRGTLSNLDNLPQELAGRSVPNWTSADATLRDASKLNISALKAQSAYAALMAGINRSGRENPVRSV